MKARRVRRTRTKNSRPARKKPRETRDELLAEVQVQRSELDVQHAALIEASSKVEESRDRFVDLFDLAPVAYLIFDEKGVIRDLNLTAAALLGLRRNLAVGMPFVTLVERSHQPKFWDHVDRCRRGALQLSTDLDLSIRGGTRLPVCLITAPSLRPEAPPEFRTAVVDLRERQQLTQQQAELLRETARREEAERSNRIKDELLAVLAHDLRAPLSAIDTWAHLLSTGRLSEDEKHRAVEVIERNVKAQADLISEMLEVSRILRGVVELEMEPVDFVVLVQSAVDQVRAKSEEKKISIETSLDPIASRVSGDPARLQQIVSGLIGNSLKFTPEGGTIEVRLERGIWEPTPSTDGNSPGQDECVRLTVRDSGDGITAEELPFVFDRFWQTRAAGERRASGVGVGLAILKRLVELHDGRVQVASPGAGLGATFIVELPLGHAHVARRPRKRGTSFKRDLKGILVLMVDDEPEAGEIVKRLLEPFGARVATVESASEAFDAFRRLRPDVLVTDLNMPDEDGFTLLERVRELPPEEGGATPAVALSGYFGPEDTGRVISAGFESLMAKPVSAMRLGALIARLAASSRRERSQG